MYNLKDIIDEKYISRDGHFKNVSSAKSSHGKNNLCYAISLEYAKKADNNPHISCIITLPELAEVVKNKALVIHEEADILFGEVSNRLISDGQHRPEMNFGIHPSSEIHPSAQVSQKCLIGPNVRIGRNAIIEDFTILDENVVVGDDVVIGCEGFFFKRKKNGVLFKLLHAGGVHLHKDVEILTGSMVQRAHDADFTVIGEGTKVSVNVNIGHSTTIGRHNIITGNVQIAGRVRVGDFCHIGTSSTISDSVVIGDNVTVRVGSVVVKSVSENDDISGNFAYRHAKRLKNFAREQRS